MTPDHKQWHYTYDAFGRRIRKFEVIQGGNHLSKPLSKKAANLSENNPDSSAKMKPSLIGCDYYWSGDRLIEEIPLYADGSLAYEASIHWLYKENDASPFARYQQGKLHYVVTDQIGTPRELLDEQGKLVWRGQHELWGRFKHCSKAANDSENLSCHLRFLGQYEDEESGLHYNRFRYYDPETAQYISPYPIGLAGGINPYGYVHNPLSWVDPLGLAACPINNEAHNAAQYAKLKEYYFQYEKYGSAGVKELSNGRYRFYGDIKPARTSGEMQGARLVREWDSITGNKRTWYETVDHAGNIRSVAPKPVIHSQNHHIFDVNGNYIGRR